MPLSKYVNLKKKKQNRVRKSFHRHRDKVVSLNKSVPQKIGSVFCKN